MLEPPGATCPHRSRHILCPLCECRRSSSTDPRNKFYVVGTQRFCARQQTHSMLEPPDATCPRRSRHILCPLCECRRSSSTDPRNKFYVVGTQRFCVRQQAHSMLEPPGATCP